MRYHHRPEPRNWDEFYESTKEHFEGYWDEICGRPDRHRITGGTTTKEVIYIDAEYREVEG